LAETWRRAQDALDAATSVALVGYSLPLTDLTAAGMISKTLVGLELPVTVVNPYPAGVQMSLFTLSGLVGEEVSDVSQFVDAFVTGTSVALAERIRQAVLPEDARLLVGWNAELAGKVLRVRRENGRVVLETAACDGWATSVVQGDNGPDESRMAVKFIELTSLLESGDEMVAEFPNGERSPLVGIDGFENSTGASRYWLVLVPADLAEKMGVRYEQYIGVPR